MKKDRVRTEVGVLVTNIAVEYMVQAGMVSGWFGARRVSSPIV